MSLPNRWVATDPGESLGYTVMHGSKLVASGTAELWVFIHTFAAALGVAGQATIPRIDVELLKRLRGIELLVYEDWQIYPWKAKELAWDECRTARGIGALEYICQAAGIPYEAQGAAIKDQAEAAGAADLFMRPLDENRHANDATRHAFAKALSAGEAVVQG